MCNNIPLNSFTHQAYQIRFNPIKVYVDIGNDFLMVTQQDVRNVVDTRFMNFQRVPFGFYPPTNQFESGNEFVPQTAMDQSPAISICENQIFDIVNLLLSNLQVPSSQPIFTGNVEPNPTYFPDTPQRPNKASIETMLDWEMKSVPSNTKPYNIEKKSRLKNVRFMDCPKPIKHFISRGNNTIFDENNYNVTYTTECSRDETAMEKLKNTKIKNALL